jgi:tetratricopeptide (TPR) repeat protein
MLVGDTFGRSLLEARRKTYNDFPDCNTWGAYQAYGDPDFRLRLASGSGDAEESFAFVAPEEVVNELNTIAERAALEPERRETARLTRLLKDCPPEWLTRGDVLAALAEAYGELGNFDQATSHYQRALAAPSGTARVSLRQVEQWANLEARWGEKTGERAPIDHAIARLGLLLQMGETSERLALLGSAHKRLALVLTDPAEVRAALAASRDCYRKAVQASHGTNAADHYAVLNWITGEALLGGRVAAADAWLARIEAGAAERFTITRSFWDAVGQADVAVLRALLDGTLAAADTVDSLVHGYEAVRRSAPPSAREMDSTLSQLKATADLLRKLGGDGGASSNALRTIWTRLGGHGQDAGRKTSQRARGRERPVRGRGRPRVRTRRRA